MVFKDNELQYRITLDTANNIFILYDATNSERSAEGVTIEEAKQKLLHLIKE
ncbi:hypothetical protein [Vagococcus acidifermentans]|uniref:hypothetical protein n=1 Tax=Vagococcus acidifermentans TaxID=564710 RepID=UPI001476FDC7|nr:hypothetical protein [Vagococcus acidifermentans]